MKQVYFYHLQIAFILTLCLMEEGLTVTFPCKDDICKFCHLSCETFSGLSFQICRKAKSKCCEIGQPCSKPISFSTSSSSNDSSNDSMSPVTSQLTCSLNDCPRCNGTTCKIGYGQTSAVRLQDCRTFKKNCCKLEGSLCYSDKTQFKEHYCRPNACKYCQENCESTWGNGSLKASFETCNLAQRKCCESCPKGSGCKRGSCHYCQNDCGEIENFLERNKCRQVQRNGCCEKRFNCPRPPSFICHASSCHYCQMNCTSLDEFEKEECLLFNNHPNCCADCFNEICDGGSCDYCVRDCSLIEFDPIERDKCRGIQMNGCCERRFGCPEAPSFNCYAMSCHYCQKDCSKLDEYEMEECQLFLENGCCPACRQLQPPKGFTCSAESCSFCTNQHPDPKYRISCPYPFSLFCYFSQRECCGGGPSNYCQNLPKFKCKDKDACKYCERSCSDYHPHSNRCLKSQNECCGNGQHCDVCKKANCPFCQSDWVCSQGPNDYEKLCQFTKDNCCEDMDCPESQGVTTPPEFTCNYKSCSYCNVNRLPNEESSCSDQSEDYKLCLFSQENCCGELDLCQDQITIIKFSCSDDDNRACEDCDRSCDIYKTNFERSNCELSKEKCCGIGKHCRPMPINALIVSSPQDPEPFNCTDVDTCDYCNLTCPDQPLLERCQQSQENCCKVGQHCKPEETKEEEMGVRIPLWSLFLLIVIFFCLGILVGILIPFPAPKPEPEINQEELSEEIFSTFDLELDSTTESQNGIRSAMYHQKGAALFPVFSSQSFYENM